VPVGASDRHQTFEHVAADETEMQAAVDDDTTQITDELTQQWHADTALATHQVSIISHHPLALLNVLLPQQLGEFPHLMQKNCLKN